MRRFIAPGALVLVIAMALLAVPWGGGGEVSADNGPHVQGAGATADGCAGCHRAHTGQTEYLLRVDEASLCYSCHGTGGSGANTIVQEGKLLGVAPNFTALRAGGFDYALINTSDPSGVGHPTPVGPKIIGALTTPEPVTSNHSHDGSAQTVWGNGAIGSGIGGSANLECGSCHDPHGNGNYRILRTVPTGSGGTGYAIPDTYGYDYDTTNYLDMTYSGDDHLFGILQETSSWCSECHTRYYASRRDPDPSKASREDSGDAIFRYRHTSSGRSYSSTPTPPVGGYPGGVPPTPVESYRNRACITCHASHGTNAVTTNGGFSESVPWPGGGAASGENTRLLKMDNRGICQKCHNK